MPRVTQKESALRGILAPPRQTPAPAPPAFGLAPSVAPRNGNTASDRLCPRAVHTFGHVLLTGHIWSHLSSSLASRQFQTVRIRGTFGHIWSHLSSSASAGDAPRAAAAARGGADGARRVALAAAAQCAACARAPAAAAAAPQGGASPGP
eukprot:851708-Prorocentrum_minimum.AAC.1